MEKERKTERVVLMKKYRIILTKKGYIHWSESKSHSEIMYKYHVRGKDNKDWVRVSLYLHKGEWKAKAKFINIVELPEWLERQYGYYMRLVKNTIIK